MAQNNYVATSPASVGPGADNTLVGIGAGQSVANGTNLNTFVGFQAGLSYTTGSYSTFIGSLAGYKTTGSSNTFIGDEAGYNTTSANAGTFLGYLAGYNNSTGNNNTFIGTSSGQSNSSGNFNTFLGYSAGYSNSTADGNVIVGYQAGRSNQTGTQNTFLGYLAGYATTSTANTFMGYRAGVSNTSGQFNSFIGVQAGQANTTGSSNYFFGTNSGANNATGTGNYFLGDNSGGSNTSGSFNIYIGANSGNGSGVNGDNNLSIGFESGKTNQSGVNNTFLGFRADAGASSLSNATAIGNNAKVNISNAVVLGSGANVGIGNSAPSSRLHITTGAAGQSGLRLENLTSGTTASVTNQTKFLTVDMNGNVILGSTISSGRVGAEESFWQRNGSSLQNAGSESVIIGRGLAQTPAGYKLYVEQGILTEKVKVAVKNTSDWSDKVFESGYELKGLLEVEDYIKTNKHLSGVPSAAEVVKQGIDMAKMDAKLLEKIEELTLYMIELKKENQILKQQVNKLISKSNK